MLDCVIFFSTLADYACGWVSETIIIIIIFIYLFIYLPSDFISQEKTATSSRSITKASKYAIPLKPTHKNLQSQSDI